MRTKIIVPAAIFLVSLAVSCALHGWLESSANLIVGMSEFFKPGAGTILFSPLIVAFILLFLAVFGAVSMLAVVATAYLGGMILRPQMTSVSITRSFVALAVIAHFVFFVLEHDAPFLLGRPGMHPNPFLVAAMSAMIAAVNLSVAGFVVRRTASQIPRS
ncbi:MAG TPA: hypothetical protein VIU85_04820 [Chthoniobacterales bacterium]